jgi:hypothetical protein
MCLHDYKNILIKTLSNRLQYLLGILVSELVRNH